MGAREFAVAIGTAADVPAIDGTYYSNEDSDAGAFQVDMALADVADLSISLDEGTTVAFEVDGTVRRTGIIEKPRSTPKHADRSKRIVTITGRDWLAEFDRVRVAPPRGWGSSPAVSMVQFNYLHPHMDRSSWILPAHIGGLFNGDRDPFGATPPAPATSKPGQHPRGWPDVFTGWISATAVDGNGSHALGSKHYFYLPILLAAAPLTLITTADDYGTTGFDGALVDPGTNPPGVQWTEGWGNGIEDIDAATHYVTARVVNIGKAFNPTNSGNPACFAAVLYQEVANPYLVYGNVVARTGLNVSGGNPLEGGDWLCTYRTAAQAEPGFTPGRAFRLLFEQAQSIGFLTDWTLDFTDTLDSNGDAWAETSILSARVNDDSLLDVIRSWHDLGVWDVWADGQTRTLHATAWGHRGNWYLGGAGVDWLDNQVISASVEGQA